MKRTCWMGEQERALAEKNQLASKKKVSWHAKKTSTCTKNSPNCQLQGKCGHSTSVKGLTRSLNPKADAKSKPKADAKSKPRTTRSLIRFCSSELECLPRCVYDRDVLHRCSWQLVHAYITIPIAIVDYVMFIWSRRGEQGQLRE